MYKNNGFFLRRRVASQKKLSFFCAAGSRVKKQRVFSAPEARSSKNNGFFLRRRVTRQKTTVFYCARNSCQPKILIINDVGLEYMLYFCTSLKSRI